MNLEIIEDEERWNEVADKFENSDVYYTYNYCLTAAQMEHGRAKLVYGFNNNSALIYPIIERDIKSELIVDSKDIITPYGYGGPLILGDLQIIKDFKEVFQKYCVENNIITEFIRLHPLLNNKKYLYEYCTLEYVRKTTAVDLVPDLNEIRSNYSKMNKRNLKKAYKMDLKREIVEKTEENIETFLNLYNRTMDRKNASEYYYFDLNFIRTQLQDNNISKSHLLFVYYDDLVISAAIIFISDKYAHYHLGASDELHLSMRPNNFIFDFMVEIAKQNECLLLHLGGGYQEDDNLFKYKTSFSNSNNYDFYIGKNIYNEKTYGELSLEENKEINNSFFPAYRKR